MVASVTSVAANPSIRSRCSSASDDVGGRPARAQQYARPIHAMHRTSFRDELQLPNRSCRCAALPRLVTMLNLPGATRTACRIFARVTTLRSPIHPSVHLVHPQRRSSSSGRSLFNSRSKCDISTRCRLGDRITVDVILRRREQRLTDNARWGRPQPPVRRSASITPEALGATANSTLIGVTDEGKQVAT